MARVIDAHKRMLERVEMNKMSTHELFERLITIFLEVRELSYVVIADLQKQINVLKAQVEEIRRSREG